MIPYKVARIISISIVVSAILFSVIILSSCSHEKTVKGSEEMAIIINDFTEFAEECYYGNGQLMIDSLFYERRVQDAPVTVWEMKDAICKYDDEVYPVRLYNE